MKTYIHEIPSNKVRDIRSLSYDVVVVGGGMAGICAAISSAREGASTILIQERSVLGGNASSEIRMHVAGASCHWGKKDADETGIIMELQLDNKHINYNHNYSLWDGVLWSKVMNQKNLDVYLNTSMYEVLSDGKDIEHIECYQTTTETRLVVSGKVYIDATGNGTLGYYAGAEYRVGSEDKCAFREQDAKDHPTGDTMGNTLMFCARDTGNPVKFIKPDWAYTFTEDDFKYRYHGDITVYHDANDVVVLDPNDSYEDHADELVEKYDVQSGYWWIELGGDYDDIIKEAEDIRYELYRTIYGVWDHIKNGGEHGAENYELIWVGNQPGIRESRRLEGKYMLTEADVLSNRIFPDAIAYGGWPLDEHTPAGFKGKDNIPSIVRSFKGLYSIPLGCYCSKNIDNLMMVGRTIGASKLAMGSTRVMGTCAVGGEAAGLAAALAAKYNCVPEEISNKYINELQQKLIKNDCYIPGVRNKDEFDYAKAATISASTFKIGCEPQKIVNGITRNENENINMWSSDGISEKGEWLKLSLKEPHEIKQIRIILDPNLSEEHCISISKAFIEKIPTGVPRELVKNYKVQRFYKGSFIDEVIVDDNYQCLSVVEFDEAKETDEVKIYFLETNGDSDIRVFEVRIY